MFTKKDRKIANQKAKIQNRDILIGNMEEQAIMLHEENKDLRFENEELRDLLTEIADRTFTCPLDSEKIVLDKIKELVRDYQSEKLTQI